MLKIIETTGEDSNGSGRYEVEIWRDGEKVTGFHARPLYECPEDATLERDLHYAYSAVNFFKLGYEAGKNNEEVVFEELSEDD